MFSAVDCELAETWDEWGDCDARCGPGIKQRVRKIVKHPLNGGKACESTVEKAACEGTNCKFARAPEGYEELKGYYIIESLINNWIIHWMKAFEDRTLYDEARSSNIIYIGWHFGKFVLPTFPIIFRFYPSPNKMAIPIHPLMFIDLSVFRDWKDHSSRIRITSEEQGVQSVQGHPEEPLRPLRRRRISGLRPTIVSSAPFMQLSRPSWIYRPGEERWHINKYGVGGVR